MKMMTFFISPPRVFQLFGQESPIKACFVSHACNFKKEAEHFIILVVWFQTEFMAFVIVALMTYS